MRGQVFCYCLGTVLVTTGGHAIPGGTPYEQIPERNVFGLKAAEVVQPPTNAPTLPKLIPQGFTTILGNKLAIFKVQYPAKPPEPAKEVTLMLAEGQSEGNIEVVQINENTGAIKFNNHGTIMLLTLDKDGAKVPNTPVAAAPPAAVGAANPLPAGLPQPPGNGIVHPTNTSLRGLPVRQVAAPGLPSAQHTGQATNVAPLTPEEQAVLLEIERERTKNQVKSGVLPPLPPTPLTPQ